MFIHLTLTQTYDVRTNNFTNEEAEGYVFKDVYSILNEEGNPTQSHSGTEGMWLRRTLACYRYRSSGQTLGDTVGQSLVGAMT